MQSSVNEALRLRASFKRHSAFDDGGRGAKNLCELRRSTGSKTMTTASNVPPSLWQGACSGSIYAPHSATHSREKDILVATDLSNLCLWQESTNTRTWRISTCLQSPASGT